MKLNIETERLLIRDIEKTDVNGIFELDSDPKVHTYLGNKPIKTLQQASEIIDYIQNQYSENGIGRWAIIDKKTNEFIGWTGLKYEQNVRDFEYYDIGYRLKYKFWGRGIATESAIASLKYGFEKLNLSEISGGAAINNIVSNTILKKIGLKFVEQFLYEDQLHNWYNITQKEWLEFTYNSK